MNALGRVTSGSHVDTLHVLDSGSTLGALVGAAYYRHTALGANDSMLARLQNDNDLVCKTYAAPRLKPFRLVIDNPAKSSSVQHL